MRCIDLITFQPNFTELTQVAKKREIVLAIIRLCRACSGLIKTFFTVARGSQWTSYGTPSQVCLYVCDTQIELIPNNLHGMQTT